MKKKRKLRPDKKVLSELFPPEIIREKDAAVEEYDSDLQRRENPSGKVIRRRRPFSMPKD